MRANLDSSVGQSWSVGHQLSITEEVIIVIISKRLDRCHFTTGSDQDLKHFFFPAACCCVKAAQHSLVAVHFWNSCHFQYKIWTVGRTVEPWLCEVVYLAERCFEWSGNIKSGWKGFLEGTDPSTVDLSVISTYTGFHPSMVPVLHTRHLSFLNPSYSFQEVCQLSWKNRNCRCWMLIRAANRLPDLWPFSSSFWTDCVPENCPLQMQP